MVLAPILPSSVSPSGGRLKPLRRSERFRKIEYPTGHGDTPQSPNSPRGTRPRVNEKVLNSSRKIQCPLCRVYILNLKGRKQDDVLIRHMGQNKCHQKILVAGKKALPSSVDTFDNAEGELLLYSSESEDDSHAEIDEESIFDMLGPRFGNNSDDDDHDVSDDDHDVSNEDHFNVLDYAFDEDLLVDDTSMGQGNGVAPHGISNYTFSLRQRAKYQEEVEIFQNFPYKVTPRDDIWIYQDRMCKGFSANQSSSLKFRNCDRYGNLLSVDALDLAKIYEFGLAANLSEAEGDMLLQLMQDIFDRHPGTNIQIRKTWRSLQNSVERQLLKGTYKTIQYEFPFPSEYFGKVNAVTKKPLKPFRTTGIDIFSLIADRLLTVKNIANFKTKFTELSEIPRPYQILAGFSTGNTFRDLSAYYDKFPLVQGLQVIPIILQASWDDTTTSGTNASSQCPVLIKVLNIEDEENEYQLIGFAPRHCPYSDKRLHMQLVQQGYMVKKHRVCGMYI